MRQQSLVGERLRQVRGKRNFDGTSAVCGGNNFIHDTTAKDVQVHPRRSKIQFAGVQSAESKHPFHHAGHPAGISADGIQLFLAFRGRHGTVPPPQAGPTAASARASAPPSGSAAAAPRDLKLRDDGDAVTVTWTDPSGGTVPFFVEAGPAGGQLRILGQLRPGETTYPVVGLNPRLDYCFSVVAVYSSTLVAPSDLVCTQRAGKPATSPTH